MQALEQLIFIAGFAQLSVLIASSLVPLRLRWKEDLAALPRLHRQLFWVYGGYVVMSIVALGLICIFNAEALAAGSRLARSVCLYGLVFWGVRLALQAVLSVRPYLTAWWLIAGEVVLTLLFAFFVFVYGWAVFRVGLAGV